MEDVSITWSARYVCALPSCEHRKTSVNSLWSPASLTLSLGNREQVEATQKRHHVIIYFRVSSVTSQTIEFSVFVLVLLCLHFCQHGILQRRSNPLNRDWFRIWWVFKINFRFFSWLKFISVTHFAVVTFPLFPYYPPLTLSVLLPLYPSLSILPFFPLIISKFLLTFLTSSSFISHLVFLPAFHIAMHRMDWVPVT